MADDDPSLDAGSGQLSEVSLGRWRWPFVASVVVALVAGVVLRFVARSPLWLDESLSVNIARLPLGDIGGALRRDGHPPLYYWMLHGWMNLFGTGAVAVRALSGLWSLALFPLIWIAAKRLAGPRVAWFAMIVLALSPYAIRYGTETRMYAMVSVLAAAGFLLVDDASRRPTPVRLVAIAVVTSALLWSHYWSIWLLMSATIMLLIRGWRIRRGGGDLTPTLKILGAMVVGGLSFLPWLPTMLYQGAHTGTPWARPLRPTEIVTNTVADFGGGSLAETILFGWFTVLLVVTGLFGRGVDERIIEIDLRTRPAGRVMAILIAATVGIAVVAGYAADATYASRYAAVFFPFVVLLAALGMERFRSRRVVMVLVAVLVVFGGFGGLRNAMVDRTDAGRSVAAIEANGQPGDLVVYCPDQLGPSTSRLLDPAFDQVTYPDMAPPQLVDWVDYAERLDRADPERFADDVITRAAGRPIFFITSTSYSTHKTICPALFNAIGNRGRVAQNLTQPSDAFESAGVAVLRVP